MTYHMTTKVTSYVTEQDLAETFAKWGVDDYQVDFNVMRSKHGRHGMTAAERGVTVRWRPRGAQHEVVLSMDRHATPQDNVRVLYLAIDALRLNEKRGLGDAMRSAYLQLEAGGNHWQTLGIPPLSSRAEIERAFRLAANYAHPDRGGSDAEMAALNVARDAALREVGP